ncbi:PIN domain-containing protein [bacterium CPR1]|nr:PIN domain-containing protein [bacterium CPR1]
MNVYLETSSVLSLVLLEPEARAVERALDGARTFLTSELTQAECLRALRRLRSTPGDPAHQRLAAFRTRWDLVPLDTRLLSLTGQEFPMEPVRTLDAIHLITALDLRHSVLQLHIASLDRRVRENAHALGFPLLPQ